MNKTLQKVFNAVTKAASDSRSLIVTISTDSPDRSGDVVVPKGGDLDNFKKNPIVLYAHNYAGLPIARAEELEVNDHSISAKVVFPEKGVYQLADVVYELYKSGFMSAWSIGFIAQESEDVDDESESFWGPQKFTKWEMLEFSAVPVPANPEALTQVRTLGFNPDVIQEAWKEIHKGVLPYKETPKAPEDESWDGPKEVAQATVDDLKAMCAWVDSANEEDKTAYKLPHHQASGSHAVVWKGVSAAMGALLGARGGVDIPDTDKKGVYGHLKKHYAQFEKDAPDFKAYTDAQLKTLFPVEEEVELFTVKRIDATHLQVEGKDIALIIDLKSGRTISAKHEAMLTQAITNIQTVLATATPNQDEDTDGDKSVSHVTLKKLQSVLKVQDKSIGLTLRTLKKALDEKGGEK